MGGMSSRVQQQSMMPEAVDNAGQSQAASEAAVGHRNAGGFTALLEASLTELPASGTAEDSPAISSAPADLTTQQAGNPELQQHLPSADAMTTVPSEAPEHHSISSQQQHIASSADLSEPPAPATSLSLKDADEISVEIDQHSDGAVVLQQQSAPEPSISHELAMVPGQLNFQAALSPLDSERTFTLQPGRPAVAATDAFPPDTPSWGWGNATSPEASFQTQVVAPAPEVHRDVPTQRLHIHESSMVPASPAESVGSVAGPQERAEQVWLFACDHVHQHMFPSI